MTLLPLRFGMLTIQLPPWTGLVERWRTEDLVVRYREAEITEFTLDEPAPSRWPTRERTRVHLARF